MNTSHPEYQKRIRTILYQDQRFSRAELELLHTPSLQRLYDLRQLGLADRVFADASHTRFSHILGVMEMATRLVDAIGINLQKESSRRGSWEFSPGVQIDCNGLVKTLKLRHSAIRLMALLHDLTHAPFGHTLEDEIKLSRPSHDHPDRQAKAFLKLLVEFITWSAIEILSRETITKLVPSLLLNQILSGTADVDTIPDETILAISKKLLGVPPSSRTKQRLSAAELISLFISFDFASDALYHLEVSHKFDSEITELLPKRPYRVNRLIELILVQSTASADALEWQRENQAAKAESRAHKQRFDPRRDAYCIDIIGDTICADLLDYANRDATQSGLPLAFDWIRIVENFTLVCHQEKPISDHPFSGRCIRAAADFSRGKFRSDVVGELIELLQVRYYVYERVLFHPTKCVAGAMLGRTIQLLGFKNTPTYWQFLGDGVFLQQLREIASIALQVLERSNLNRHEQFMPMTAAALEKALPYVDLLSTRGARELWSQRVTTVGDLRRRYVGNTAAELWILRLLQTKGKVSFIKLICYEAFAKILGDKAKRRDDDQINDTALRELATEIAEQAYSTNSHESKSELLNQAKLCLGEILPSIDRVQQEIEAASQLLSSLQSRRYSHRVFCLMPSHIVAGPLVITPEIVAERFLDPDIRGATERAIEAAGDLPLGSVVIHCPPAKGPRKIAKVLVSYLPPAKTPGDASACMGDSSSTEQVARESTRITTHLREIGKIEGPAKGMFGAHERHLESLEAMYSSMWRLWVAVTPPSDIQYKRLGDLIANVLGAIVFLGNGYHELRNDLFMVEELEGEYSTDIRKLDESTNVPESPIQSTSIKNQTRGDTLAGAEQMLTRKEVEKLLQVYLVTFSPTRQKRLGKLFKEQNVYERISTASQRPEVARQLRAGEVYYDLTGPTWEARDVTNLLILIDNLIGSHLAGAIQVESNKRSRMNDEEQKFVDRLIARVRAVIAPTDIKSTEGAVRICAIARQLDVVVKFQPLLTRGLYGRSAGNALIILDSREYNPESLSKIFEEGETLSLLPNELRFTLAHELAHHLIASSDDAELLTTGDGERAKRLLELSCNNLAGEMLIATKHLDELVIKVGLSASSVLAMAAKLCVGVQPLLVQLSKNSHFRDYATGFAIIHATSTTAGLQYKIGVLNRTAEARLATFRALGRGDSLPLADLCNTSVNEEMNAQQIAASLTDETTETVRVTMIRDGVSNNGRIVVVQLVS